MNRPYFKYHVFKAGGLTPATRFIVFLILSIPLSCLAQEETLEEHDKPLYGSEQKFHGPEYRKDQDSLAIKSLVFKIRSQVADAGEMNRRRAGRLPGIQPRTRRDSLAPKLDSLQTALIRLDSLIDDFIFKTQMKDMDRIYMEAELDATKNNLSLSKVEVQSFRGQVESLNDELVLANDRAADLIHELEEKTVAMKRESSVRANSDSCFASTQSQIGSLTYKLDSVGGLAQSYKRELDEIEKRGNQLDKKVSIYWSIIIVAAVLAAWLTFLLGRQGLKFWSKIQFYPCLVLDEQDEVVLADVMDEEAGTTQLRQFEREPLKAILKRQENREEKIFEVGIETTPGKKVFFFRQPKKDHTIFFNKIYDQETGNRETRED